MRRSTDIPAVLAELEEDVHVIKELCDYQVRSRIHFELKREIIHSNEFFPKSWIRTSFAERMDEEIA